MKTDKRDESGEHAVPADDPERSANGEATPVPDAGETSLHPLDTLDAGALRERAEEMVREIGRLRDALAEAHAQLATSRNLSLRHRRLAELARHLNVSDPDEIAQLAVGEVAAFFEAPFAALLLHDEATALLTLRRQRPEEATQPAQPALHIERDDDVLVVHIARNEREPVLLANAAAYETRTGRTFRPMPVEAPLERGGGMICPLVLGERPQTRSLIGALLLAAPEGGFLPHDRGHAALLAEMLASSLRTAGLLQQLAVLADTDGLTGLFNHRRFQQEMDRSIAYAQRYGAPLSLLMIDIDRFKKFNDTHGHQAGDLVLREVAQRVLLAVRDKIDIVSRYGGEEFTVLLPNTDLKGALVAARRIRENIAREGVRIGGQRARLTVSIGVAQFESAVSKSGFLAAADDALYAAKKQGRNRAVASPRLFE